jgi:O-antigen ligase
MFIAKDEVRYFVLDTITFENSSSITHAVEWFEAIESMISDPQGIGLATSGNAGGVEREVQVGGENQYLIYGVQLGFLGLLLYLGMLLVGIKHAWKAFRLEQNRKDAIIPFVAATVKFGLLLPLFTANAEAYLFVSLISWWMIGFAETSYQRNKSLARRGYVSNVHVATRDS